MTFVSPAARAAIRKELLKKAESGVTKQIMNKLDNAVPNLTSAEKSIIEKAAPGIEKNIIDPLRKKNGQGGFITSSLAGEAAAGTGTLAGAYALKKKAERDQKKKIPKQYPVGEPYNLAKK